MYSAVRLGGKHLYEYARQGVNVERKPREVVISALTIVRWQEGEFPRLTFDVECSKGTYVRTLCHDIGEALGPGGHMSYLLRLRSGPFKLEESWTLEEIEAQVLGGKRDFLLPLPKGLDLPEALLPRDRTEAFANGLPTAAQRVKGEYREGGQVQVLAEGKFLGIGMWREDKLFPHKVIKLS